MSEARRGKGGRPRKSEEGFKVKVTLRVARGELRKIDEAAVGRGLSRSEYIRGAIEGEMKGGQEGGQEVRVGEYMAAIRVLGDLALALEDLPEGVEVAEVGELLGAFLERLESFRVVSGEVSQ